MLTTRAGKLGKRLKNNLDKERGPDGQVAVADSASIKAVAAGPCGHVLVGYKSGLLERYTQAGRLVGSQVGRGGGGGDDQAVVWCSAESTCICVNGAHTAASGTALGWHARAWCWCIAVHTPASVCCTRSWCGALTRTLVPLPQAYKTAICALLAVGKQVWVATMDGKTRVLEWVEASSGRGQVGQRCCLQYSHVSCAPQGHPEQPCPERSAGSPHMHECTLPPCGVSPPSALRYCCILMFLQVRLPSPATCGV